MDKSFAICISKRSLFAETNKSFTIFIGKKLPFAETNKSFTTWEDNQISLNSILFLISNSLALSIIKKKDISAIQKYQLLKAKYNRQTLIIFNILYWKIS